MLGMATKVAFCLLAAGSAHAAAATDTYPAKPVRFIIGYAAGGIVDANARTIAQYLSAKLGQNFIIESRLGAGGRIAADYAAKSAADGYVLSFTANGTHSFAAVTEKNLPYDPVKDFTPIALIGTYGFLMVVHPSVPAKSVGQLIELARKNPGKLNYSSSGTGSGIHFAGELFNLMAKVRIVHVPYKGAALGLQDVIGGHVEITYHAGAHEAVNSGRVRLLATTGSQRDPRFPDTPTLAQAGLSGYELISWTSLFGPPKLPAAITSRLNAAVNEALKDMATARQLRVWGTIPSPGGPEQLAKILQAEIVLFRRIVAETKMTF
ncbi:MAG: Bug family tripartite tricarboxylate transporter substrate binding protein [Betaproteobacteria bacterium]